MSCQRGNVAKSGPPKHQNKTAFKNDMHDKSKQTKMLNDMEVIGACAHCTEVIQWKIKYKKYKPLTVPKKCTVCQQKTVKRAYYIMCDACSEKNGVCGKCGKKGEVLMRPGPTTKEAQQQQAAFEKELDTLSERQRRTFFRLLESGKLSEACRQNPSLIKDKVDEHPDNWDEDSDEEPDNWDDSDDEVNAEGGGDENDP